MAGRAYAAVGDQTVTTPLDTCITVQGSATMRADIYYLAFSCLTDELDDMLQWTAQRFDTADGTGTAVTPTPFIDTDIASQATVLDNHTVEPTYVAGQILLDIGVNTRSMAQWHAVPGREMSTATGANEGIGIGALHASSTPAVMCTVYYLE